MIEVSRLSHTYPGASRKAVDGVSFAIERGRIFGFLGPSGAGKTTTQNVMTGLLPLQAGKVLYDGKPLAYHGRRFFNEIGVSFEYPNLYEKLTGLENLQCYAALFSVGELVPAEKVLDMVGLGDARHKRVAQYSRGMKQRLVFARAIQHRPSFLFLDEPTGGLDPSTAAEIKGIILGEKKRGATIFLTTHNMFLADEICDVVAFINEGRIVAQDSPRDLKLRYGQKSLRLEYRDNGEVKSELLFLGRPEDQARLGEFIASGKVETLHSQEATLEQIFMKLTGRGLSG